MPKQEHNPDGSLLEVEKTKLEIEKLRLELKSARSSPRSTTELVVQAMTFLTALATLVFGLYSGLLSLDQKRAEKKLDDTENALAQKVAELETANKQLKLSEQDKLSLAELQRQQRELAGLLSDANSAIRNIKAKLLPAAVKSAGKTTDNNKALNTVKTAIDSLQSSVSKANDIASSP